VPSRLLPTQFTRHYLLHTALPAHSTLRLCLHRAGQAAAPRFVHLLKRMKSDKRQAGVRNEEKKKKKKKKKKNIRHTMRVRCLQVSAKEDASVTPRDSKTWDIFNARLADLFCRHATLVSAFNASSGLPPYYHLPSNNTVLRPLCHSLGRHYLSVLPDGGASVLVHRMYLVTYICLFFLNGALHLVARNT